MDSRETDQLYYASSFYFEEAEKLLSKIDPQLLELSLGKWGEKFKGNIDLYKESDSFYFSCHLDSCAIRLYSIEENIKNKSKRWCIYRSYIWIDDNKIDENDVINNLNFYKKDILHFILRHATSHDEDWAPRNHKKASKIIKKFYMQISHNDIYNCLKQIKNIIKKEIFLTNLFF